MFGDMINNIRKSIMEGSVAQLYMEVPGINKLDQEMLKQALDANLIPERFPYEKDMVKELAIKRVSGKFNGRVELESAYLKEVLLPIALIEFGQVFLDMGVVQGLSIKTQKTIVDVLKDPKVDESDPAVVRAMEVFGSLPFEDQQNLTKIAYGVDNG